MMSNALISEAYELQQYYNRSLKKIRESGLNSLIAKTINPFSGLKNKYNNLKNNLKNGLSNIGDIGKTAAYKTIDNIKNAEGVNKVFAATPVNMASNLLTTIKDKVKDKVIGPTVSAEELDAQSQKLVKTLQDQNKVLKQQIDELTKENEALTQQLASANATASANAEQAKAASQSAAAAAYPGATISA